MGPPFHTAVCVREAEVWYPSDNPGRASSGLVLMPESGLSGTGMAASPLPLHFVREMDQKLAPRRAVTAKIERPRPYWTQAFTENRLMDFSCSR